MSKSSVKVLGQMLRSYTWTALAGYRQPAVKMFRPSWSKFGDLLSIEFFFFSLSNNVLHFPFIFSHLANDFK